MSKAGILSSRGDAYQTLVAMDWAISVLSSPDYAWLEVESPLSPVDDVVIGMTDGRTTNCQCKKNQVGNGPWSVRDLAEDLGKAAKLLATDEEALVRFYSKSPFGDLQSLRENAICYSDESHYRAALPKGLSKADELLGDCLESLVSTYDFLARVKFCVSPDDSDEERRLRSWLGVIVSRPDLAFMALWECLDRLGARVDTAGEGESATRHRLRKEDLRKLLADVGSLLSAPIDTKAVIGEFERLSAVGRSWPRKILKKALARPVVEDILAAISERKKCILLTGKPGEGKTCVMLDVQEALENRARSGESIFPLFIQSRSYADAADLADREAIGLPAAWVEKVARLSEGVQVVVVIDSLDVLSIAREHDALSYFLSQLERLKTIPDVTVLAACRKFDRLYDPRLASFHWDEELECGDLEWDAQIAPILSELGVDQAMLDDRTRTLIGNPRNLALFCDVVAARGAANFPNALVLSQRFLEIAVRDVPNLGDLAIEALENFAMTLLKERSLSLPTQRFAGSSVLRSALTSVGVLAPEERSRISFGHQTLLDVLAISSATRKGRGLGEFISSLPEAPFVRPSIRCYLDHLEGGERKVFRREVRAVLFGEAAFHIRRLVAEYLPGRDPSEDDWPLYRDLRRQRWDLFQIIYHKASSLAWHRFWLRHLVPFLDDTRDVEGMKAHVYMVERWASEDPRDICEFWLGVLNLPWLDGTEIARRLGLGLSHIAEGSLSSFAPLLKRLLDFPLHQHSYLGVPIARCVKAGLVDDSVLWRYIVGDVGDDCDALDLGNKLRCKPHEFERQGNDFLAERMNSSTMLLDKAIEMLEKWSEAQLRKYGIEARYWRGIGYLSQTSYRRLHTRSDFDHIDALNSLLDAMEAAISNHAEGQTAWWRKAREHLGRSLEGALRYFAIKAFAAHPEENSDHIAAFLCDQDLLESGPDYEIAMLIKSAFPSIEEAHREAIMAHLLILHADREGNKEDAKWVMTARLRMLSAIPHYLRPPEIQGMLDDYERAYGRTLLEPEIESWGGVVSPPFPYKVFLEVSDYSVLRLLGHYRNCDHHISYDRLEGGKDMVRTELTEAASRSPTRFLNLLTLRWYDIEGTFREAILGGLSRNLQYRFGNLTTSSPWEPAEDANGPDLCLGLIRELERHSREWHHSRDAADAIQACSCVVEDTELAERLVLLAFDYTTAEENEARTGYLLSIGFGMIRGRIAEAMIRLANRLLERDIPWPYLLESMLFRVAGDDHPPVRAMIVQPLAYLISKRPELGWKLFDTAMIEAEGLWTLAEPCLYYFYRSTYGRIGPALERLFRSGTGEDLKTWGRIAALTTLDKLRTIDGMIADLSGLASEDAWTGAAQVWTNWNNIETFPELCAEGLRAGLVAGGVAALATARAIESMFHQAETSPSVFITPELFENCLHILQGDETHKGPHFWDLGEWLIGLSANHPDEAMDMAFCFARFMKGRGESIYDYEDRYPSLLTNLFREAEERELSDNGDLMRKVLELQDLLVSVGIASIEGWLRSAERQ